MAMNSDIDVRFGGWGMLELMFINIWILSHKE